MSYYAIDRETGAPLRYDAEVRNAVVTFGANPGDPMSVCQKGYLAHLGMTRERAEQVAYEYRRYRAEVRYLGEALPPGALSIALRQRNVRMKLGGYDDPLPRWETVGDPRRRPGH